MVNLKKGVSNGLGKGGGIKNGTWATLRKVMAIRRRLCPEVAHALGSLRSMRC